MTIREAADAMEHVLRQIDHLYYMNLNRDILDQADTALMAYQNAKFAEFEAKTESPKAEF